MIVLLILGAIVASYQDHEQDHDQEQEQEGI
jgi:hypothetical protein